jgi:hypothetical protein
MKILLFLLHSALILSVSAQDLPDEVLDMLAKLKEFESSESKLYQEKVAEKRVAVSKFLEQSLTRETKAGNLEIAVAIKAKITALSGAVVLSRDVVLKDRLTTTPNRDEEAMPTALVGTIWTSGSHRVEFISNTKAIALGTEYFWQKQQDGAIELSSKEANFGTKIQILLDLDAGKGTLFNRLKKQELELKLKR